MYSNTIKKSIFVFEKGRHERIAPFNKNKGVVQILYTFLHIITLYKIKVIRPTWSIEKMQNIEVLTLKVLIQRFLIKMFLF